MERERFSRRDVLQMGGALATAGALRDWRSLLDLPRIRMKERVVVGAATDFMVVRHLRLEGSNFEIGRALAKLAKDRHSTTLGEVDTKIDQERRAYFAKRYPAIYERAKGVSEAYGLAWAKRGQDVVGLGYDGIDRPGCSTVFYAPSKTESGHGILSRNYDFTTQTLAEMIGMPASRSSRPFTGDPYILELWPDKGHASLALVSYDLLAGAIDGVNSKGLAVALLADDVSPGRKPADGPQVGLGEIEVPRFLLDTCATVEEAKAALFEMDQYYTFIPCHYIVADRSGESFVWERSIPEGEKRAVDGKGGFQVVTNHLLSDFPKPDERIEQWSGGSFNRYCRLRDAINRKKGKLSVAEMKAINLSVQAGPSTAVTDHKPGRTLWHSIYDLESLSLDIDFYLGEDAKAPRGQKRSGYQRLVLGA